MYNNTRNTIRRFADENGFEPIVFRFCYGYIVFGRRKTLGIIEVRELTPAFFHETARRLH